MKKISYIPFLFFFTILCNCVTENDVFNNNTLNNIKATNTSLIVSFLNEYKPIEDEETNNKLTFIYPLDISYNTNQIINVINQKGLQEIINSQSNNFHINGIVYPISVEIENTVSVINNTTEFNNIIKTLSIVDLKTTILNTLSDCLSFEYPIVVLDSLQSEINITNNTNFIEFINSQDDNYILTFKFPFILNNTSINNYFNFYQITNTCITIPCPEISFNTTNQNSSYTFTASGHSNNITANYVWSINDEFIQNGLFDGNNNESFTFDFLENGTYNVCTFIETPECPQGIMYCQDIIINTISPCPEISFNTTNQDSSYTFTASGHSNNITANYVWSINDEFIQNGLFDGNNNESFTFDFLENGTYKIGVFIETPECPQGVEYFENIIINTITSTLFNITVSNPIQNISADTCNDLTYSYTNIGNNIFSLELNSVEEIGAVFSWFINGDFIETGTSINYEFVAISTYTICVIQETPECPLGVSFCRDFTVE